MTGYIPDPEFYRQTILVSLDIVAPGSTVMPSKSKNAAASVGGDDESPIGKAIKAFRSFHNDNTLPWLDEGARCLPTVNHDAYRTEFEGLKDAFETAVRDHCKLTGQDPAAFSAALVVRELVADDVARLMPGWKDPGAVVAYSAPVSDAARLSEFMK